MDSIWTTFDRELARMSDPQWGWYRTGMQHVFTLFPLIDLLQVF